MKSIFYLLFFFIFTLSAQAQLGILSGRINQQDGEPLPAANILVANNKGTVSDVLGNFQIANLPSGTQSVLVSFIGFESVSQNVIIEQGKETRLDVTLKAGSLQLADITVTANNGKQLTSISAIDIKLRPVNTAQDVLRMVPGLFIAQHAGELFSVIGGNCNIC